MTLLIATGVKAKPWERSELRARRFVLHDRLEREVHRVFFVGPVAHVHPGRQAHVAFNRRRAVLSHELLEQVLRALTVRATEHGIGVTHRLIAHGHDVHGRLERLNLRAQLGRVAVVALRLLPARLLLAATVMVRVMRSTESSVRVKPERRLDVRRVMPHPRLMPLLHQALANNLVLRASPLASPRVPDEFAPFVVPVPLHLIQLLRRLFHGSHRHFKRVRLVLWHRIGRQHP